MRATTYFVSVHSAPSAPASLQMNLAFSLSTLKSTLGLKFRRFYQNELVLIFICLSLQETINLAANEKVNYDDVF